ncbi:S41 family peptidase [Massilia sp. W12]|uniref:S41 family peptidase n=1 Tax=Massilia sp. W12 TaxID=3126507 RepID=UPI0030CCDD69
MYLPSAAALASIPLLTCLLQFASAHAAPAAYVRHPAVSSEYLVFSAEGDLWRAPLAGGQAQRLSTAPDDESQAAISPDGKWIAYQAAAAGVPEVWLMPLAGGAARRLSFENQPCQVLGWSARGEVLYSTQYANGPTGQSVLKAVDIASGALRTLPLLDVTEASLSADGKQIFFTRFGLRNDNARLYRGGAQQQIWRFALDGSMPEAQKISDGRANERSPMWWQGQIYFISDRDGHDNLWRMQENGGGLQKISAARDFQVRQPRLNQGRIVWQQGADLWLHEIANGDTRKIALSLNSAQEQQQRRWVKRPFDFLSHAAIAPQGERVVFNVRGQGLVGGLPPQRRLQLNLPAGMRLRHPMFSHDGKLIYGVCDQAGREQEICSLPANGAEGVRMLTRDGQGQRTHLALSPDGKTLAHSNLDGTLWLLDIASGNNSKLMQIKSSYLQDLRFSPDSKTLAIGFTGEMRDVNQVWLLELASKKLHQLTSDKYVSHAPSFSPDGDWLYLLSERHFHSNQTSPWGDRRMGVSFDKRSKLYAYALRPGLRFPFQPKNELESKPDEAKKAPAALDLAGAAQRIHEVPLPSGNYTRLANDGKRLYVLEQTADGQAQLKVAPIDQQGQGFEVWQSNVANFELSQDAKKLMLQRNRDGAPELLILDAASKPGADLSKHSMALADWPLAIEPAAEWRQMFDDAWRMQRDYFFDRKMRGVDWQAMYARYAPLTERLASRVELNDLLAQLNAELGTLHSQIRSGDVRRAEDAPKPGFLGAQFEPVANGLRISHIYQHEAELPDQAAPLARPETGLKAGDIVQALNGRKLRSLSDLSLALENQANQSVLLDYLRPDSEGRLQSRQAIAQAVDDKRQAHLRYADWEWRNAQKVLQASGGRIGYLHLRDMTGPDLGQFVREYYAHIGRAGLIIDVRRNGGGSIDSWITEKLLRRAWAFWQPRHGLPETNMQGAFLGKLVVLADEQTYSDGETFAAAIKQMGLGTLLGRRTSGAGVWLSDNNNLADRGRMRASENAQHLLPHGEFTIEGVGVTPDIDVENLPHASFKGQDAQLEQAIKLLQEKIQAAPAPQLRAKALPPLQ